MTRLQKLRARLRRPLHLQVLDAHSYREFFGLRATLGRLAAILLSSHFAVFAITVLVVFFTPVREWVPGYIDSRYKAKQQELLTRLNYLEDKTARQDSFINALQRVSGYVPPDSTRTPPPVSTGPQTGAEAASARAAQGPFAPVAYAPRRKPSQSPLAQASLLWPVAGLVSRGFSPEAQHFGLDIAAAEHAPVLAIAEGMVILTEYSALTGYVIGIEHPTGLISFYKHNQRLLKRQGEYVAVGELIATAGSTGELTTGTHVHLELWFQGRPQDPLVYLRPRP